MKLIEKLADDYACGINRKDGHGISSFPDTFEKKAYIAGFKAAREMAYDFVLDEDEYLIPDMGEQEIS